MTLSRITGFRLVVGDARRLIGFYEALGFAVAAPRPIDRAELALLGIETEGRRWPMTFGESRVDLDQYAAAGRPIAAVAGMRQDFQHLALVTAHIAGAWARAKAAGAIAISRDGPVTLPPSSGGVTAVKFRDPEGHPLEFLQRPHDRANAEIRIDHSAIVTSDRAASETFYRSHGLTPGEPGCNHGIEQALLDGVPAPIVDVVPMLPVVNAPHVELLAYRAPTPGRASWSVVDHVATRFVWEGDAPALIRDPDGHFHQVSVGR